MRSSKGFACSAIWIGCRGSVRPGQANFHVRPPINLEVWIFTFAKHDGWAAHQFSKNIIILSFVCSADSILLLPPSSREGNSYCQMKTPRFSFLGKSVWEKVQSREEKGNFLKYNFAAKLTWLVEPFPPFRYNNGHVHFHAWPCIWLYDVSFLFFIFSSVLLICVRIPYLPDLGGGLQELWPIWSAGDGEFVRLLTLVRHPRVSQC